MFDRGIYKIFSAKLKGGYVDVIPYLWIYKY